MQCPQCGTHNPEGSEWCSLCLVRFDRLVEEATPSEARVHVAERALPSAAAVGAGLEGKGDVEVVAGPLRKAGDVVEWVCPRCERANPLDLTSCGLCGTSFYEAFGPQEQETPTTSRSAPVAAGLSVLPGAGHFYLGRPAEGVVRLMLAVWWISTGLLVRSSPGPLLLVKVTYLLAAGVLVLLSVADAYRAAEDAKAPALLSRRVVMYGSLALIGLLMMSLAIATQIST